jgi:hypothetical protein
MVKTRALRDEPPPGPVELAFRGILGDTDLRVRVAGKAVACLASYRHTGNVFRPRPGPGLTAGIETGMNTEEKTIMARAAAAGHADATTRGPLAADPDRTLAELELAWSEGGYHGFTAADGTWCAITSAGEVLIGATPGELARAIRAHLPANSTEIGQ